MYLRLMQLTLNAHYYVSSSIIVVDNHLLRSQNQRRTQLLPVQLLTILQILMLFLHYNHHQLKKWVFLLVNQPLSMPFRVTH